MTMSITDAEDALLLANAGVQEWADEFRNSWFAPLGATMMAMLIASMPPEVLDRMHQINPEGQDALAQIVLSGGK